MLETLNIPEKSSFKEDEVCRLTGVKPYVLKFWESQFDEINPLTSATGKKVYEHSDIQAVALIKKFLFEEKLSVEKAKERLEASFDQLGEDESDLEEHVLAPEEGEVLEQVEVQRDFDYDNLNSQFQKSQKRLQELELMQKNNSKSLQKIILAKAKIKNLIVQTYEFKQRLNTI
ncbi:MAG: MerR family transcriptional regulator [Bacteriovoracaceae bacterium]